MWNKLQWNLSHDKIIFIQKHVPLKLSSAKSSPTIDSVHQQAFILIARVWSSAGNAICPETDDSSVHPVVWSSVTLVWHGSFEPSWDNRWNSQIPKRTCPLSYNAPFRTEMCTFLFWMVHCGIWNRSLLGDLWDWSITYILRGDKHCMHDASTVLDLIKYTMDSWAHTGTHTFIKSLYMCVCVCAVFITTISTSLCPHGLDIETMALVKWQTTTLICHLFQSHKIIIRITYIN